MLLTVTGKYRWSGKQDSPENQVSFSFAMINDYDASHWNALVIRPPGVFIYLCFFFLTDAWMTTSGQWWGDKLTWDRMAGRWVSHVPTSSAHSSVPCEKDLHIIPAQWIINDGLVDVYFLLFIKWEFMERGLDRECFCEMMDCCWERSKMNWSSRELLVKLAWGMQHKYRKSVVLDVKPDLGELLLLSKVFCLLTHKCLTAWVWLQCLILL